MPQLLSSFGKAIGGLFRSIGPGMPSGGIGDDGANDWPQRAALSSSQSSAPPTAVATKRNRADKGYTSPPYIPPHLYGSTLHDSGVDPSSSFSPSISAAVAAATAAPKAYPISPPLTAPNAASTVAHATPPSSTAATTLPAPVPDPSASVEPTPPAVDMAVQPPALGAPNNSSEGSSAHCGSASPMAASYLRNSRASLSDTSTSAAGEALRQASMTNRKAHFTRDNLVAYMRWVRASRGAMKLVGKSSSRSPHPQLLLRCEHWLEVTDEQHRYGSNLRVYFDYWVAEMEAAELTPPPSPALMSPSPSNTALASMVQQGQGQQGDAGAAAAAAVADVAEPAAGQSQPVNIPGHQDADPQQSQQQQGGVRSEGGELGSGMTAVTAAHVTGAGPSRFSTDAASRSPGGANGAAPPTASTDEGSLQALANRGPHAHAPSHLHHHQHHSQLQQQLHLRNRNHHLHPHPHHVQVKHLHHHFPHHHHNEQYCHNSQQLGALEQGSAASESTESNPAGDRQCGLASSKQRPPPLHPEYPHVSLRDGSVQLGDGSEDGHSHADGSAGPETGTRCSLDEASGLDAPLSPQSPRPPRPQQLRRHSCGEEPSPDPGSHLYSSSAPPPVRAQSNGASPVSISAAVPPAPASKPVPVPGAAAAAEAAAALGCSPRRSSTLCSPSKRFMMAAMIDMGGSEQQQESGQQLGQQQESGQQQGSGALAGQERQLNTNGKETEQEGQQGQRWGVSCSSSIGGSCCAVGNNPQGLPPVTPPPQQQQQPSTDAAGTATGAALGESTTFGFGAPSAAGLCTAFRAAKLLSSRNAVGNGSNFFRWLDNGPGLEVDLRHLGVPRAKLDAERVKYLTPLELLEYELDVEVETGLLRYKRSGKLLHTGPDSRCSMDEHRRPPTPPPPAVPLSCLGEAAAAWWNSSSSSAAAAAAAVANAEASFGEPVVGGLTAAEHQQLHQQLLHMQLHMPQHFQMHLLGPRSGSPSKASGLRSGGSGGGGLPSRHGVRQSVMEPVLEGSFGGSGAAGGEAIGSANGHGTGSTKGLLQHELAAQQQQEQQTQLKFSPLPATSAAGLANAEAGVVAAAATSAAPGCAPPGEQATAVPPLPVLKLPVVPLPGSSSADQPSTPKAASTPVTPAAASIAAAAGGSATPAPAGGAAVGPTTPVAAATAAAGGGGGGACGCCGAGGHGGGAGKEEKVAKWIYVVDPELRLFVHPKVRGRFHHSSFLRGGAVVAAGGLAARHGQLRLLTADSGHYWPREENFRWLCEHLVSVGADLSACDLRSKHMPVPAATGRELMERMGVPPPPWRLPCLTPPSPSPPLQLPLELQLHLEGMMGRGSGVGAAAGFAASQQEQQLVVQMGQQPL